MANILRNFPEEIRNELAKVERALKSGNLKCEIPMEKFDECTKKVESWLEQYKPQIIILGNSWKLQSEIREMLTNDSSKIEQLTQDNGVENTKWNNYEILNIPKQTVCFETENLNSENHLQPTYIFAIDTDNTENIDETVSNISKFIMTNKYINLIFSSSSDANINKVCKLYYKKIKSACGKKKLIDHITIMNLKDIVREDLEIVIYRDFYRSGDYKYVKYAVKTLHRCTLEYQDDIKDKLGYKINKSSSPDLYNIKIQLFIEMMNIFKEIFMDFSYQIGVSPREMDLENLNAWMNKKISMSTESVIENKNFASVNLCVTFCDIFPNENLYEEIYLDNLEECCDKMNNKVSSSEYDWKYITPCDVDEKTLKNKNILNRYKGIECIDDWFQIRFKHDELLQTIMGKLGELNPKQDKIDNEIMNVRYETLLYLEFIKLQYQDQMICHQFVMELWEEYFGNLKAYYFSWFNIGKDLEIFDFKNNVGHLLLKIDNFNDSIDNFCKIEKEEKNRRQKEMDMIFGSYNGLR